jgi:excisionase family DNA binding protein
VSMPAPGTPVEPLTYGPADAAAALGVSRAQVYELLAQGELHGRKMGRRTLISRAELVRYIDSLPAYDPTSTAHDVG